MTSVPLRRVPAVAEQLWNDVARRCSEGERLALLFVTADGLDLRMTAALARPGALDLLDALLPRGAESYPALTPKVPAAFWYEREIHDLFALWPEGHPRLDPLILPLADGTVRPCPGSSAPVPPLSPHEEPLPAHLAGAGIFTIPHGPVRSGVMESVEYLIETPGEDIPHLRVRPHAKHRGIEQRFQQLDPESGVLLAERVEGIASVAHATAYAQAMEDLAGATVPRAAALIRLVHAELERVANHLDVAMRLTEAAALSVATARFGWHKERVMRLRSDLCGSRYGRGVVTVGGVRGGLGLEPHRIAVRLEELEHDIGSDERAAMATPSFLDRLRGTGPLAEALARRHAALGPVGRASGAGDDVRASRPYGGYQEVAVQIATAHTAGDVQARLQVRWAELHEAFRLMRHALTCVTEYGPTPPVEELRAPRRVPDGRGVGWAEAPQGEVLYVVEVRDGQLSRVKPRSASFHNLPLFHSVFAGDIFTDFPFIEASFGLSIAGVAL
jgi:formate hydrogenlyase subunit 5